MHVFEVDRILHCHYADNAYISENECCTNLRVAVLFKDVLNFYQ